MEIIICQNDGIEFLLDVPDGEQAYKICSIINQENQTAGHQGLFWHFHTVAKITVEELEMLIRTRNESFTL